MGKRWVQRTDALRCVGDRIFGFDYAAWGDYLMKKIEVSETGNPTPNRSQDYCAVFEDYDGAEDSGHQCIGMGSTKQEAINNLSKCCLQ